MSAVPATPATLPATAIAMLAAVNRVRVVGEIEVRSRSRIKLPFPPRKTEDFGEVAG